MDFKYVESMLKVYVKTIDQNLEQYPPIEKIFACYGKSFLSDGMAILEFRPIVIKCSRFCIIRAVKMS